MVEIEDESADAPATTWRGAFLLLLMAGAVGAVVLVVVGVGLLIDINGPGCHGEFPFCTTPSQQSARHLFAEVCGVGVLLYLVAALPAFRARRFNWSHVFLGAVIALAIAAVIVDPVSHLEYEGGSGQWFIGSWPL